MSEILWRCNNKLCVIDSSMRCWRRRRVVISVSEWQCPVLTSVRMSSCVLCVRRSATPCCRCCLHFSHSTKTGSATFGCRLIGRIFLYSTIYTMHSLKALWQFYFLHWFDIARAYVGTAAADESFLANFAVTRGAYYYYCYHCHCHCCCCCYFCCFCLELFHIRPCLQNANKWNLRIRIFTCWTPVLSPNHQCQGNITARTSAASNKRRWTVSLELSAR